MPMDMEKPSFPFDIQLGLYKKQIDNRQDPSKNHPIHDAVEKVSYGGGRYEFILTLDGVSGSKSAKKLVPIGKMLCWDLARFCQESTPEDMEELIQWFAATTQDPKYRGKGNTTVALLRFDRLTGAVDGFSAGDSPVLLALDRLVPGEGDAPELRCAAEVLAPLHCVANYPGVIYNGWRHGTPFVPSRVHLSLPEPWVSAYLITMSDGYGKIAEDVALELYDYNEADQILADRFPDFARVFLPAALHRLAPDLARSPDGRVQRADLRRHEALLGALSDYYDHQATEEERRELEVIDLDCVGLRELMKSPSEKILSSGRSVEAILAASHRSLQWMREARYMDNEDETGLEEYLRQYVMAKLFTEAMISALDAPDSAGTPLHRRLHAFGEGLGPVGDDFAVAVMRIVRTEPRKAAP